jgi:two-component system, NarL family, nitrate/nitrite response regulator NarL
MPTVVEQPIRILIIDDQVIVSTSLRLLLESRPWLKVVGETPEAFDAFTVARDEHPDIILLDIDLGDTDGLDLLPDLLSAAPQARVVVLTGIRDPEIHRRAVRLGAMGLVTKAESTEVLLQAIAKVHAGEVWLDHTLLARVLGEITRSGTVQPVDPEALKIAALTPREREVIVLVGQGYKNRQIANRLFIAEATVRHHLTSIFAKLGVADRLELVIYAYRHDLSHLAP